MNKISTILIVDDTSESLSLLTKTLTAKGYAVRPADCGELALASIAVKLPDLILLDIRMPDMDGFEVCRRLKVQEETREIPVIMITAESDVQDKVEAFRHGAVDYIVKPFQPEELLARVKTHLGISRLTNELKSRTAELDEANKRLLVDIAERKQAQEALRESETKFRRMVEQISDVIFEVDHQGAVLYISPAGKDVLGFDLAEAVGNKFIDLVHPDDRDLLARRFLELSTGVEYPLIYRLRNKSGDFRWVRTKTKPRMENGVFIGASGTLIDITDQKLMAEALENSLSLLGASLESTADGILIVDRNGKFTRWNQKFVDMWRIPEEVLSSHDDEKAINHILVQLADPEQFIAKVRELYEQPEESSFDQIEFSDGRVFERYSQPQRIGDNAVGRVWSFRDITDRKLAEEDKAKLEAQNRQLQKSESLGRMAGAIAHTFNNQLGVVIGNLEMAMDDMPQDTEHRPGLTAAMQAAQKAAAVSGQMLTYLGQTPGIRESLDLSEACYPGLPMLRAIMPGKMILETDFSSPGPTINANANQVQQVVTNLITNAWEAAADGRGAIHLSVKTVTPAEIPVAHRRPIEWQPQNNAYACLEVKDAGGGIADRDIEKLFDPFFSSKFAGRGMGLAVVLGIVRAHNGVITVKSKPGRGSTFRVFFPVSMEEITRQPEQVFNGSKFEGGGTVLLADDEEMVRNMASAMLKRLGFAVLKAKDGMEAVELFRQHRDEIRLVVSDLTMPRMNGWETLTALRKLDPNLPVILASGYDKAHVMHGDHPELPQVFLNKPYKLNEFGDAIGQALVKEVKG